MENPRVAPRLTPAGYQVGDLRVDVARAQVWRNGAELPLPKLSFDFLLTLIQAAPGIVSIDDLMDRVWSGVIVGPETVSQRAKLLRAALGDDSRSPRYVLSVRGRGYRLIADVSPVCVRTRAGGPLARPRSCRSDRSPCFRSRALVRAARNACSPSV
jgi:DNA-binding winged helix-turn-helix (wHTH) protein